MEPPGWIFVVKDNCMVMLGDCRDAIEAAKLGDHIYCGYLRVDTVDGYYKSIMAKSVIIPSPLKDKLWGMREFGIISPEGHHIMIGQILGKEG